MSGMSSELRSLLSNGGVEKKVIDALEAEKCTAVHVFAVWVDEPKEWTEFVKAVGDTAGASREVHTIPRR